MWAHVASKGIIQDVFITLIFQDIIYKVWKITMITI